MITSIPSKAHRLPWLGALLLLGGTAVAQQPEVELNTGLFSQMEERRALRPIEVPVDSTDSPDASIERLSLDGMVVDETVTRVGREFYDAFFGWWSPPEGALAYTVFIQEQPLPTLGTFVIVRVNDEIAFQTRLQPQVEVIEGAARQAVGFTHRFLEHRSSPPTEF